MVCDEMASEIDFEAEGLLKGTRGKARDARRALLAGGDWYGHPVNLASRITTRARPGSVLTSEEVHETLADPIGGPLPAPSASGASRAR